MRASRDVATFDAAGWPKNGTSSLFLSVNRWSGAYQTGRLFFRFCSRSRIWSDEIACTVWRVRPRRESSAISALLGGQIHDAGWSEQREAARAHFERREMGAQHQCAASRCAAPCADALRPRTGSVGAVAHRWPTTPGLFHTARSRAIRSGGARVAGVVSGRVRAGTGRY